MKVAVTGGTGFVGEPLVDRLVNLGHDVRVLTRSRDLAASRSLPWPPRTFDGAEAVVHLAGEPIGARWTHARKERVLRSRVEGTHAVVELARREGTVRTLVSASAIGFYGSRGDAPLRESEPSGSGFQAEVCRAWEEEARAFEGPGRRVVIVRIGLVLHPAGGALAQMLPAFRLGLGGRLGSGLQYVSWIYRDDLVALLERAVEDETLRGPLNAAAPGSVTQGEFARELGRALGRPAVLPMPAWALRLLLGEMADLVLDSQRVVPEKALQAGFRFRFPALREALSDLLRPAVRN